MTIITKPSDICTFLRQQSNWVWQRIQFAREMNLRISEVTLTEELLFRFYKAYWDKKIPIRLFESEKEYQRGSDLEILIKTNKGFLLLVCQAKITYKSYRYRSFHHLVDSKWIS